MVKLISATLSAIFLIALAGTASAQSRQMEELIRNKQRIEQQKADAETARAQAAASAVRQQARSRPRSSPVPHELPEGDPLEGTDAQKCELSSGATIRVSGRFTPSNSTKCDKMPDPTEVEEE